MTIILRGRDRRGIRKSSIESYAVFFNLGKLGPAGTAEECDLEILKKGGTRRVNNELIVFGCVNGRYKIKSAWARAIPTLLYRTLFSWKIFALHHI